MYALLTRKKIGVQIFKNKNTMMMPGDGEDILKTTGGQIDNIVFALIDATLDRNDNVTQAIQSSLFNIGKHQPNLLALVHKIIILGVVEKICGEVLNSIKKNVAVELIKLAVDEMVNTKEIVPEWQNLASGILVSLGRNFNNEVMEQLLLKFQPGVLPHFFVVQTMANLASANVFGMVPFLKSVLGTMLPLLGMVKSENMKWIFAYALSKFCEAILEYIANAENHQTHQLAKKLFVSEITSAYDVLFINWLPSREAKVRSEVVVALGHMTHLLSPEKLEEHLPRFIPAVLAIYKRHQEYQHTTRGLCMVLDASIANHSVVLESQLDSILNTLFPQICSLPDYSQPSGVRNHNEVLRCFAVLASVYSNRLVAFLLQKLESSNEAFKIGSLTVFKHLINSCDTHISSKVPIIISGLKPCLDSGNKVIVTLAHHDHLKSEDGLDLVKFIIYQCALPDDPVARRSGDPSYVSNEALRGMCENVIHLLTTTVEKMEDILWPSILDCLMDENLTSAISVICKSLTTLASKKREELGLDFTIDYGLLTRLCVVIGRPHEDRDRGLHVLKFMKAVAPAIHKGPVSVWDKTIPLLIQHLESFDSTDWEQKPWENKVTDFVSDTLAHIDREDWIIAYGKALLSQFNLYTESPDDKFFLPSMFFLINLGLVIRKIANKVFLNEALDAVFENVNHSNATERLGCALAVGLCGSSYADLVLVKLENVAKNGKKSAGLFGFIRVKFTGDSDHEKLKATIILCYGHITINTPIQQISPRIETPILRCVANLYSSSKDPIVKQSMLETIKLIADAVQSGQKKGQCLDELRSRSELLGLMRTILKSEATQPLTSNIRSLALNASASLVSLDPVLKDEDKRNIIQMAVGAVYSLPRDFLLEKPKEEGIDPTLDFDKLLISTVDALNFFLQKLVLKERTFANLESVIHILHKWMISKNAVERERCLHSTLHLLRSYAEATESDAYAPFNTLGNILGMLVPRCTDPQITVRHLAFDSIDFAVSMAMRVQVSAVSFNERPEFSLNHLKSQIISDDPSSLFSVTKCLGKFICEKLPLDQLYPFIRCLVNGLCDPHSQSSSGASVVLNSVIKHRGRELRVEIPNIIEAIRDILNSIHCPHTRKGALRSFQNLANHHLTAVLVSLLNSPVPLDVNTIDIWQTLCQDKSIANHIIEYFLEIFSDNVISSPPDPHGRSIAYVAAHKPLAAVCALREMFKVSEMESCSKEHFDRLLSSLLIVSGAYVGAVFPVYSSDNIKSLSALQKKTDAKSSNQSPVRFSIEALKNFLLCIKEDVIVSSLNEGGYWVMMEELDKYPEAVAAIGRSVCICCPDQVPKLITVLNPMLNSSVDVHRIVSVSLFVVFLSQNYKGRKVLTEPLMNSLLGRLVDSSPIVRRLCISGLGNISMLDKEQIDRYSTTILSAMMTGMDDREDPGCNITLEAMSGLSSILSQVAEEDIRNILINIALRIKPMFEKEKPLVRAAAFTLFGNLSRFANGPSKEQFVEQIHGNLVPFLLHLNDEDKHVIKACKYSLRLLGPILELKEMNEMFQKHLLDDAHLHYGEFINDLTKTVISECSEKVGFYATTCMSYLKSPFTTIQCNATAFLGYLLGNIPVEKQNLIAKERVCSALLVLLKDQCPEARSLKNFSLVFKISDEHRIVVATHIQGNLLVG
ncbi:maestro heat-like repeat-containing protein family member 1 [Caerostris extrusa]|uniref:Maestro heat-like repeat-containing protein family member 1 n=1 Tax=Caerostris extrusa TaxID=172846 RepID=A0AAV4MSK2_CAEEX|nr:maestro heat-like repeat-containing protein family member 1 [Caerostris extrusa]